MDHAVAWRREDVAGHGIVRVAVQDAGKHVKGFEATVAGGARFDIHLDDQWRTRTVAVESLGSDGVYRQLQLESDGAGVWLMDGIHAPQIDGCVDVDLFCVPITNTLPIQRLSLATGERAVVTAVWVGLPELEVERLEQVYQRIGPAGPGAVRYEYRPSGSEESTWMTVDGDGIVIDYQDFATRIL